MSTRLQSLQYGYNLRKPSVFRTSLTVRSPGNLQDDARRRAMRPQELVVSASARRDIPNPRGRLSPLPAAKHRVIRIKRVYAGSAPGDGVRVLVDRLWPRGLSKERADADLWFKDAAPSIGLRRWYGHQPRRWQEFNLRYREELARQPQVLAMLDELRRRAPLTLLFAAVSETHNHAVVLRKILEEFSSQTAVRKENSNERA